MKIDSAKLKHLWLGGFCILVILMVSVGGITRLTRSGLSIVEWKPVSGIIPPITETDWQQQFDLYKQTPEYTNVNTNFQLSDYKEIFMWEYLHRVLGRLIFLFVVVPGFFLWRKKIVSGRLVFLLAGLVAVQGLIGWLMVKTGLNLKPHVSPFMLALHFFAALSVLLVAFYNYIKSLPSIDVELSKQQKYALFGFGILLSLQVFYGCLTSGLKAGVGYNDYPLMNGQFFPEGGLFFNPLILNFFENPATVQWTHRWLGMSAAVFLVFLAVSFMKSKSWPALKNPFLLLLGAIVLQVTLGILNILYIVPVPLAALHQFVAALLVLCYFRLVFLLPAKKESR